MAKIKSIKKIENQDVYNLYVTKNHNFAINGGLMVHNCDALRYACTSYTFLPDGLPTARQQRTFNYSNFALEVNEYEVIDLEEGTDYIEMGWL